MTWLRRMEGVTVIDRTDRGDERVAAEIASHLDRDTRGAMRFEKWQALGNDYVIVEREALPWELTPERIQRICEPHFGIGSDGILLLSPADDPRHEADLRIFNPDGSEAELSGNGAREAALYIAEKRGLETFTMITTAGEVVPTVTAPGTVAMESGRASLRSGDYPSGPEDGRGTVEAGGREWAFQHVHIGNPQCAIEVNERPRGARPARDRAGDRAIRALPQPDERLVLDGGRGNRARPDLRARGGGDPLVRHRCDGAAVAAHVAGAPASLTVALDGGELGVEIAENLDVRLTGTAQRVYSGELADDFMEG